VESLRGQFLVAAPSLEDPSFWRTVVLVAEHSEEGALGVILNRATEHTVAEVAPELVPLCGAETPLHLGGPVQSQGIVVLAEFADPESAAVIATGALGLLSAETDIEEAPEAVRRARPYAGHAGWGPGQLDEELEREDWILAPVRPEDVFTDAPDDLWRRVLRRLGGQYALVARLPADPSLN
jgi:putative transcriptional regulator